MRSIFRQGPVMLGVRLRNFTASFAFATSAFLLYLFSPHFQDTLATTRLLFGNEIIVADLLTVSYFAYSTLLLLFYLAEKRPGTAKAVAAWRALGTLARDPVRVYRLGLGPEERVGLLSVLLRVFFAPLILASLFLYGANVLQNGVYLLSNAGAFWTDFLTIFNTHGYWFLFQLALVIDLFFFAVGYLVDHPVLRNQIRSVDSTLLGWGVMLACYPPFNGLVGKIMGWGPEDFPQFEDPNVQLGIGMLLLVIWVIYSAAAFALNFKLCNLTYRGIVRKGPYRFVRHPAYVCKNVAWWIGTIPALSVAWQISLWETLLLAASAAAWTGIYVLRALTEEDHLRKVDGEYGKYCETVRYRFVPGLV